MLELIDNQYLMTLALERTKSGSASYSQEQILEEFGITQKEIDETEVDFE